MHILADIGGTKLRIAGTRDGLSFGEPSILDTPHIYDDAVAAFVATAKALAGGEAIERVVFGIRGANTPGRRGIVQDDVLSGWSGKPLADDIQAGLSASQVIIENDTALVGLGEAAHGAGAGASIVAYLTVSTGIGGVRVTNGVIDSSRWGFEPGGQLFSVQPKQTLEDLVSGAAIHRRFNTHPKELGKEHPVWEELAAVFAQGLHNTILHWSPERVVLGGSMFNEVGISVPRVAEHVRSLMTKLPGTPDIVHSALGDIGGLWGALARLKQL